MPIASWLRRSLPVLFFLAASTATAVETRQEFDKRITAELRARDPMAADLFVRADAAVAAGDQETAVALYRQVRARQPDFTHATRRLAGVLLQTGRDVEALELFRDAVATDPSRLNLAALASALVAPRGGKPPTADDKGKAVSICEGLTTGPQNEPVVLQQCAWVGIAGDSLPLTVAAAATLERIVPDEMSTTYFAAISHAVQGQFIRAELDLRRARDRGLAEAEYQRLRAAFRASWPWWVTVSFWSVIGVALWSAAMTGLLVVGIILSRATLKEAESIPESSIDGAGPSRVAVLRRIYAAVIAVAAASYYLSLPLLIAVVLLFAGGVFYLFTLIGRIPIQLAVGLVVVVVVTIFSILKSLLVMSRDEDPGMRADLEANPRLKSVLEEVAARIGTRPVDSVFLLPGTEFAVMERGGVLKRMRERADRCLLVGVGVLDGFRLNAFRAVLAHEYGHFVNRDTSGGGFALSVRRSMNRMAQGLAASGSKMAFSPAWWFLAAFSRLFARISHGASRLQEVMADRWAVSAYGAAPFSSGLRHVIERSIRFGVHAQLTVLDMQATHTPVNNLYAYTPKHQASEDEVRRAVDEALSRQPTVYDSHPSPTQRFEWASRIGGPDTRGDGDADDAWQLFEKRREIEVEMTSRAFV
jgi:Zn-dependent protease with chaperone function